MSVPDPAFSRSHRVQKSTPSVKSDKEKLQSQNEAHVSAFPAVVFPPAGASKPEESRCRPWFPVTLLDNPLPLRAVVFAPHGLPAKPAHRRNHVSAALVLLFYFVDLPTVALRAARVLPNGR